MPDGGLFGQGAELAQAGEIDPQQAAPCVGSRSRSRGDPDPVEEIAELNFGPVQNRRVTPVTRNASKTAGERLYATHGITPLPMPARRVERA